MMAVNSQEIKHTLNLDQQPELVVRRPCFMMMVNSQEIMNTWTWITWTGI
jgi:hypothetical protein